MKNDECGMKNAAEKFDLRLDSMANWKTRYQQFFALFFWLGLAFIGVKTLAEGGLGSFDQSLYGRRKLILFAANLRLALGERVFPNMLVGKDGWLFMTAEKTIEDYQGVSRLSDEQVTTMVNGVTSLRARLQAEGKRLLIVIVPNKQTLYPDKMPPEVAVLSPENRLTQFYAALQPVLGADLIDLRPVLQAARSEQDVYLQTDTHWNAYGSYLTYREILRRLQGEWPALTPRPLEDFTLEPGTPLLMDLTANTGGNLWLEKPLLLTPNFDPGYQFRELELGSRQITMTWKPNDSSLPRLLMYHDSFGFELRFLLAERFSQAVFVPHFSGREVWNLNWIEQESPDVVVFEFAERYVDSLEQLFR